MELESKKIMFVGPVGVGKTTLTQRLKGLDISYFKTQAIQFYDSIIDTPGEFLQHRRYYNALSVTAAEAEVIGLLVSATASMQTFPQGFSSLFNKPVIGIVTKVDLVTDAGSLEKARAQLLAAGAKEIFEVSLEDNRGIEAIQNYLTKES
ncbi:TPA: EutP/PduV family microcompartment system protein [Streptococcus suis]|nr:EutP/PduV family microcompartment system protein [Streptococcus suis]HEM4990091.1 EutP/PduV family microcompartment system protein [Streptococcus suis]HEM5070831.1 EutP/PduV family microcompartment system protein [Streptococcus suis]HEM5207478.1 EutP/PduV family microcompartment system protein [Streptococcus suis]HEM5227731.1 EutP/PduV family microcompartment system protein [Streptococcus suis]